MISVKAVPIAVAPSRRMRRGGFTLIEMLVVVTIILGMAGMLMVGMSHVREEARAAATRATIAKINQIIMQKWESFETRRIPVDMSGLTPRQAAEVRLLAIRYLQKLEMPDRMNDIVDVSQLNTPITLKYNKTMPYPALARLYGTRKANQPLNSDCIHAKMLYMVCMAGSPESREMFNANEIGTYRANTGDDGWPVFLDGWGHPIYYLRWAPGYSRNPDDPNMLTNSDIQSGDYVNDHDPFDPQRLQAEAFHLIPLIYSAGPDMKLRSDGVMVGYGINAGTAGNGQMPIDPFDPGYAKVGSPANEEPGAIYDNITNHRIEH